MSWKSVKLDDVCVFEGGSQPPKTTFNYSPQDGYVRLIQIQDYRRDDVAVYIPSELARRFCNIDDVMIGRYGPPVFQILRGLEGAYNVALMKAYPKNEKLLDKNFLFYLLQEESIQNAVIQQSQRSAGQTGVDKDFIENRIIYLPNITEQRHIAAEIERKFVIVEKARQTAVEQLRDARFLNSAYLREVFKGNEWETVELGDVCKIVNGSTPKTDLPEYWDGDIIWVTPTDLGKLSEKSIYSSERKITHSGYNFANTNLLPINSIVLSTRAPIGHIAINRVELCTNQGCKGIIPSNDIYAGFLYSVHG